MFGEDTPESRYKDVRYLDIGLFPGQKMVRKQTNEDLMEILLISSDPVISKVRPLPVRQ